jgi:hypothetical protein
MWRRVLKNTSSNSLFTCARRKCCTAYRNMGGICTNLKTSVNVGTMSFNDLEGLAFRPYQCGRPISHRISWNIPSSRSRRVSQRKLGRFGILRLEYFSPYLLTASVALSQQKMHILQFKKLIATSHTGSASLDCFRLTRNRICMYYIWSQSEARYAPIQHGSRILK